MQIIRQIYLLMMFGLIGVPAWAGNNVSPAPNGIKFPAGYQNWRVISMSHRVDNKTVRVIYGNDTAIEAARAGKTKPCQTVPS